MSILRAPCYNCPDRKINCHSKCPKYLKFRKHRLKIYEKRAQATDLGVTAPQTTKAKWKCRIK